jgi:hypothetical protein
MQLFEHDLSAQKKEGNEGVFRLNEAYEDHSQDRSIGLRIGSEYRLCGLSSVDIHKHTGV